MSGGHFNGLWGLRGDVEELRRIHRLASGRASEDDMQDHCPKISAEISELLSKMADMLDCAFNLLKAADYFIEQDIDEKQLKETWQAENRVLLAYSSVNVLTNEQRLRDEGWFPVSEVLSHYKEEPSFCILKEIDSSVVEKVSEQLDAYAYRPAFFNLFTGELMEVGSWEDLYKALHHV